MNGIPIEEMSNLPEHRKILEMIKKRCPTLGDGVNDIILLLMKAITDNCDDKAGAMNLITLCQMTLEQNRKVIMKNIGARLARNN